MPGWDKANLPKTGWKTIKSCNSGGAMQDGVLQKVNLKQPDGNKFGGVCKAMCALWVRARHNGGHFWKTLESDATVKALWLLQSKERSILQAGRQESVATRELQDLQKQVAALPTTSRTLDLKVRTQAFASRHMDRHGQNLAYFLERNENWFGEFVARTTDLQYHRFSQGRAEKPVDVANNFAAEGFYVFHMEFENAGHSVTASIGSDKRVHFMVPNYGEIVFDGRTEFLDWWRGGLVSNYSKDWGLGAMTECQLDHFDWHGVVKPPEGETEWRTVKDVERFNIQTVSSGTHRQSEPATVSAAAALPPTNS